MAIDEEQINPLSALTVEKEVPASAKENEADGTPQEELQREKQQENDYDESLYYGDDDDEVAYAAFDGKEALQIIEPIENEALFPTASSIQQAPQTQELKKVPIRKADKSLSEYASAFLTAVPPFVEHTGAITVSLITRFFSKYGAIAAIPFVLLFTVFKNAFLRLKSSVKHIPSTFSQEIKGMRYEVKIIHKKALAMNKTRFAYAKAMRKYFVISFSRHRIFWKTVFNTVFPLVMIILSVLILNSAQKKIYALEVVYNGSPIGFVESETVFEQAKTKALKLLPESIESEEYAKAIAREPVYKLTRVTPSQLGSEDMLCENIITACDASLIRACGIYIDGEFLCAVKNESDAASVFSSILAPSKAKAQNGSTVAFVEEISYVQGLYPSEAIWDSLTLKSTISKPKSEAVYHKTAKNESAKSVAKKYGLTVSQLKALNPDVDFSALKKNTKLLVAAQTSYVRVKVMKTRTRTQSIPFETVTKQTALLSKGTKKVSQNGRNGQYTITELVTYINGKETYSTVVSKKQTLAPVNKIILEGTKVLSYYGGSYSGSYSGSSSSGGMIWPTRGAYRVSSHYGYRSASISGWSFHGGMDIVRSGGGSTGTPVVAAASGTVVTAVSGYSGYGHYVIIDHGNGLRTLYAHMQSGSLRVRAGQTVYQGQQIGNIGGTGNVTGPHLHFEVLRNGSKVNPYPYIR